MNNQLEIISFLKKVFFFAIIFLLINLIFGEVLLWKKKVMIHNKKFYPELTISEFYSLPKNSINVLYIGSSRAYSSFIPKTFDSITGMVSYNLGTSGQSPVAGYFLLKEVFEYQKPSVIFIDLSHEILAKPSDEVITGGYVFDAMKWSSNKFWYFIHGFNFSEKIQFFLPTYLFLPTYRFRNNIFWVLRTLILNNNTLKDDGRYYGGSGYVGSKLVLKNSDLENPSTYLFEENNINEKRKYYLIQMITYIQQMGSKAIVSSNWM